jgi:hypothetical protein
MTTADDVGSPRGFLGTLWFPRGPPWGPDVDVAMELVVSDPC